MRTTGDGIRVDETVTYNERERERERAVGIYVV